MMISRKTTVIVLASSNGWRVTSVQPLSEGCEFKPQTPHGSNIKALETSMLTRLVAIETQAKVYNILLNRCMTFKFSTRR
jgi:hypothetical protein